MVYGVSHVGLATARPELTKEFFARLFDWEFESGGSRFSLFTTPEGPGGALEVVDADPSRKAIQVYVRVDSLTETIARAEPLGAVVVRTETEIEGGYGSYALLREPGGAVFGLWKAAG